MGKPKNIILSFLYPVKLRISKAKLWLWIQLGLIRSVMIVPYKGFGNENEIYIVGRVLKDKGIGISSLEDSSWQNIKNMLKRFTSMVIPGVRIKAEFLGMKQVAVSDDEGYFEFRIQPQQPIPQVSRWQKVTLTLLDRVIQNQGEVKAESQVFIPKGFVEFGIISDIDDTIISTGATRLWLMLKTTFAKNAYTRIPFPGVSAFYMALEKGTDNIKSNPFFYVSSSPWNLYDFLMEFLEVHDIPKGPLMLRDLGLSRKQFIAGNHAAHKLKQIEHIMTVFQDLPFILIGDSGQEDPEIYLQVVKDFPGRIRIIYIRDVRASRSSEMAEISREMDNLGVEMILVKDTIEASRHAFSKGWIHLEDIEEIGVVKKRDEKADAE